MTMSPMMPSSSQQFTACVCLQLEPQSCALFETTQMTQTTRKYVGRMLQDAALGMPLVGSGTVATLVVDLGGFAAFGWLYSREADAGERRIVQRQQVHALHHVPGLSSRACLGRASASGRCARAACRIRRVPQPILEAPSDRHCRSAW